MCIVCTIYTRPLVSPSMLTAVPNQTACKLELLNAIIFSWISLLFFPSTSFLNYFFLSFFHYLFFLYVPFLPTYIYICRFPLLPFFISSLLTFLPICNDILLRNTLLRINTVLLPQVRCGNEQMLQHSVLRLVFDSITSNLSAGISSYRGKILKKYSQVVVVIQFNSFIYVLDNSQKRPITAKH
jgi:hypothetical protein